MNLMGPKRKRALRWAIYLLTVLAIIGIPVSIWSPQRLRMHYTGTSKITYSLSISLQQSRISIYSSDVYHNYAKPSWSFGLVPREYIHPNKTTQWWHAPTAARTKTPSASMQTVTGYKLEIPLVYLIPLLAALSLWMMRRTQKQFGSERCESCGYQLADIKSKVCPECGSEHA